MTQIIPSILTNDPLEFKNMLSACEGIVDRVHIDIIDGIFADNKTIEPSILERTETNLNLDFHLMVQSPQDWVEKCIRAGADRIIAQIETMKSQLEYFGKVQIAGAKVGLALDLETSLSRIDESILPDLDVVLVMSVKAGFGGQDFDSRSLDTIKQVVDFKRKHKAHFAICVDGGETSDTIDDVVRAGAEEVAIGRRLFEGDMRSNLQNFVEASKNGK